MFFDRNKLIFKRYSPRDGLASNVVTSICENKEGDLVIGTMGGLSIFNKRDSFTNYYNNENNRNGLSSSKIKAVFADKNGNIFIGTEDDGINYLAAGENVFHNYRAEDKSPYALSDNSIFTFYEDRSGTYGSALIKLDKIKIVKKLKSF
jgi:ligand-binding sensor domain-containing protein